MTSSMQTFCLHPSKELFDQICKCDPLRRKEGDDFEAWRLAALWRYGDEWGLEPDDTFVTLAQRLSKKTEEAPSKTTALQILHLFFATGDLDYIEAFYECMGHEKIPEGTRRYLVETYKVVKELYCGKLHEVSNEQLDKLGLRRDVVDFSYFDDAKERAIEEKKNRITFSK